MIHGCDFCDGHVEAIRPRSRLVELDDGTTVLILLRSSVRLQDAPPLLADQEYIPRNKRVSLKAHVVNRITLPAKSQIWVQVKTKWEGLFLVTLTRQSYDQLLCLAGTGIEQVKSNEPLHFFVANFRKRPRTLLPNKTIGTAEPHPIALMELTVTLAEALEITKE